MLSIVVGMVLGVLLAEHLLIVYLDFAAAGQRLCGTQIRCRFDNFFQVHRVVLIPYKVFRLNYTCLT